MANINEEARIPVYINDEQAKSALKNLRAEADKWRKSMYEAMSSGDMKGMKSAETELKKVNKQMAQLRKESFDVNKILNNLSSASPREIRRAIQVLNKDMEGLNRNTTLYAAKQKQLQGLRSELYNINGAIREQRGLFSKSADYINRYWSVLSGAALTVVGIKTTIDSATSSFGDFEERVDNLSALTGLEGDQLGWLTQRAKDLSEATLESGIKVKQGAQDIVDAFTKTGSARPELLKDKEALSAVTEEAIILANAAKTELEPGIEALTMMLNQFNGPASDSRRIINALAAGSKEGAGEIPYLTTAVEKSGTVAADAKLNYETLIATIETLAPRITKAEIAGRSLKGVILDMQRGTDDINPSIVGWTTALENLNKKKLSTVELTKMFGEENITSAKILLNNIDELKRYETAVTSTNVAIEQASTNTDNRNAQLAQAKNRLENVRIELGEKLAPALTFSTNSSTYFLKVVKALVEFTMKYGRVIITTVASIAIYTAAIKLAALWETRHNAQKGIGLVLSKTQALWNTTLKSGTLLYAAAKAVLTGNTVRATAAMRLFNTTIKMNPVVALISILATAAVAFLTFRDNSKEAASGQKELNDEIERGLELSTQNKTLEERASVMKNMTKQQLESLKSDLEQQISTEEDYHTTLLQNLKKALDEDRELNELYSNLKREDLDEEHRERVKQLIANRTEQVRRELEEENKGNQKRMGNLRNYLDDVNAEIETRPVPGDAVTDLTALKEALEKKYNEEKNFLKKQYLNKKLTQEQYNNGLLKAELDYVTQIRALLQKGTEEYTDAQGDVLDKLLKQQSGFVDLDLIQSEIDAKAEELEVLKALDEDWLNYQEKSAKKGENISQGIIDQWNKEVEAKEAVQNSIWKLSGLAIDALVQMAGEESEAGKALFLLNQARAVGEVVFNTGIANAKALAASPITFGQPWVGINTATAAVSVAGILAQTMMGYSDGGHTGSGGKYEVAGTVHKGEYVIPQEGVNNANLRPVIEIMEYARQNGKLARLDLRPVVASISSGKQSLSSGGMAGGSSSAQVNLTQPYTSDPELTKALTKVAYTMDAMQKSGITLIKLNKKIKELDDILSQTGMGGFDS